MHDPTSGPIPANGPPWHKLPDNDGIAAQIVKDQAQQIAVLESRIAQLEHQVMTDELTGLMNRRGFTAAFAGEHDRIKRRLSRGGLVVMIDLDGFKLINDTHGHDAGDACLICVGKKLRSGIRGMDAAARLGGDEFALLLTNTHPDAAIARVQRLSVELNKLMLPWQGQNLFIGASIGVRPVGVHETLHDILMQADADMYANKREHIKTHLARPLQSYSRGQGQNPPPTTSDV